jgi:hypothetical protein
MSKKDELHRLLIEIEVSLAKIGVHLDDIKSDLEEIKHKNRALEDKVEKLESFKAKVLGAGSVIIPVVAFIAAVGHDIIKKFMGWM